MQAYHTLQWGTSRDSDFLMELPSFDMIEAHPFGGFRLKVSPFLTWCRDNAVPMPFLRLHVYSQNEIDPARDKVQAVFRNKVDADIFKLAHYEWWN